MDNPVVSRMKENIVTAPTLVRVEVALVEILASYPGEDIRERELRGLLKRRGFRRSAPAFIFTMMGLADKGLVTCREEVNFVDGMETKERYYRQADG
jgi:hypothetical protein